MTLTQLTEMVQMDELNINDRLTRCEAFIEASIAQLEINKKEAELKVIAESGTDEDYMILVEAAQKEADNRVMKSIETIIASVKKFLSDIAAKVTDFMNDVKTKAALDKAAKAAKNPKIGNKKIEMIDADALDKIYQQQTDLTNHFMTKIKTGNISDSEVDAYTAKMDSLQASADKIKKNPAAKVIGIAAAIVTVAALAKKLSSLKDKFDIKTGNASIDTRLNVMGVKMRSRIEKERAMAIFSSIKQIITAIGAAATGKGIVEPDESVTESKEAEAGTAENTVIANESFDAQAALQKLEQELFSEAVGAEA